MMVLKKSCWIYFIIMKVSLGNTIKDIRTVSLRGTGWGELRLEKNSRAPSPSVENPDS